MKQICTEASVDTESEKEGLKQENWSEEEILDDTENDANYRDSNIPKSIVTDHNSFQPIYSIGYWSDFEGNNNPYASVAILIFSGILIMSDFSINIVGGRLLEYKVVWPVIMTVSD